MSGLTPEFPGRASISLLEDTVKITEIAVPHMEADIRDGQLRAGEKEGSLIQPLFLNQFRIGFSGGGLDGPAEPVQIAVMLLCQIRQFPFPVIFFDKTENLKGQFLLQMVFAQIHFVGKVHKMKKDQPHCGGV